MANRDERNEYATAKWDAEEVRRQAASEQHRRSSGGSRRRQAKRNRTIAYFACVLLVSCLLAGIGNDAAGDAEYRYGANTEDGATCYGEYAKDDGRYVWQQ